MSTNGIKDVVREKYGKAARRAQAGEKACCGPTCCGGEEAIPGARDPITSSLYEPSQTLGLPAAAVSASLGCGNPTALAELHEGETVLDLGSGGGIDVLLSARRVGETGKVYGLDMTDEMLALARANAKKAEATNVEFLKGELENVPLPDGVVDVIISNCVVNLSDDKDRALAEAFRVLRPGGRFAVSDVVVRGEVPADVRKNVELWIGCLAGALEEKEFEAKLVNGGIHGRLDHADADLHDRGRAGLPLGRGNRRGRDGAAGGRKVHERVRAGEEARRLRRTVGAFERYLSLWVALCMAGGIALGKLVPGAVAALRSLELGAGSHVNVPIMVLIWLMVAPMMARVDFAALRNVGKEPRGLAVTLFVNWVVKPFSMAFLAWLFFRHAFAAWIAPARGRPVHRGRRDPRGGAVHGDGVRLEPPDGWRPGLHARPGRPERPRDARPLRADREVSRAGRGVPRGARARPRDVGRRVPRRAAGRGRHPEALGRGAPRRELARGDAPAPPRPRHRRRPAPDARLHLCVPGGQRSRETPARRAHRGPDPPAGVFQRGSLVRTHEGRRACGTASPLRARSSARATSSSLPSRRRSRSSGPAPAPPWRPRSASSSRSP